jgi:iduronate 2-sulfatase
MLPGMGSTPIRRRAVVIAGIAALCVSAGGRPPAVAAAPPNVLFIMADDLRPELAGYGSPAITPNLDRLAARGVRFERAYCQQAVCNPSRSSLLTGRRPDTLGIWSNETHFRDPNPAVATLPGWFKAHGYEARCAGKIFHNWHTAVRGDPGSWSAPEFLHYANHGDDLPLVAGPVPPNLALQSPRDYGQVPLDDCRDVPDEATYDGRVAAEAVRQLGELGKGPFFLAVGFWKPHAPFNAPKRYWDLYDPDAIPAPRTDRLPAGAPAFAGHKNAELHNYPGVPAEEPIPADVARTLRHGYYACISYTDAQIGRLLDALDAEGLADDTIVVLWGDHGWQLGDHGLWHKHTNFELATRAPLLVSVPKGATAGRSCAAPVEFVDVYPTLADLCGLPLPPGLEGASLKPFLADPAAPAAKVAISQYPRGAGDGAGPVMGYSIRDERWRLTLWRERHGTRIVATELYDEANDPAETVSLHDRPEHRPVIESLSRFLPPPVPAARRATAGAAP